MAYEITATRKRPQTFDQIVGQEFIVATLKSSIEQGRIAHAYLFSGPRGVGKTSAARILAKALNCESGPTTSPCGACSVCEEITAGISLDVIEIDGASNTSVNDVREIKDEVLFSPNSSRYKIYIIDEVHMLSNSAFNALLKTIEEPPPYIVFIFATTEIHKVPATIRSRCQQFNFRLISVGDTKKKLAEVVKEMGLKAEDEALMWIARESTGSLRDAYTLLDQIVSFSGKSITQQKIRDKLGVVGMDELGVVCRRLASGNTKDVLEETDKILARGIAVEQFVIDLTEYFRNILFISHNIRTEATIGISSEEIPVELLKAFSPIQIEKAIEYLLELYRRLRYSLNQRFELELTMSRLSRLGRLITNDEILARLDTMRAAVSEAEGIEEQEAEEVSSPAEEGSSGLALQNDVIEYFKRKRPTLASALEKAHRWSLKEGELALEYERKDSFSGEMVLNESKVLSERLSELVGKAVRVKVNYGEGNETTQRDERLESQVEMVKKVFKGEVVQGE
jgi:DNA polymerase-3 subunit gamma/tau